MSDHALERLLNKEYKRTRFRVLDTHALVGLLLLTQ